MERLAHLPVYCATRDMLNKNTYFLFNKKTCVSRSTRRHVCLLNGKTCFLFQEEGIFSCVQREAITRVLVQLEDMSPCSTRRYALLFNTKTCHLVEQEDMSSCWTRRHVFLFNMKTCFPAQQEHMFSCSTRRHGSRSTRRHAFSLNKRARPLV